MVAAAATPQSRARTPQAFLGTAPRPHHRHHHLTAPNPQPTWSGSCMAVMTLRIWGGRERGGEGQRGRGTAGERDSGGEGETRDVFSSPSVRGRLESTGFGLASFSELV